MYFKKYDNVLRYLVKALKCVDGVFENEGIEKDWNVIVEMRQQEITEEEAKSRVEEAEQEKPEEPP